MPNKVNNELLNKTKNRKIPEIKKSKNSLFEKALETINKTPKQISKSFDARLLKENAEVLSNYFINKLNTFKEIKYQ